MAGWPTLEAPINVPFPCECEVINSESRALYQSNNNTTHHNLTFLHGFTPFLSILESTVSRRMDEKEAITAKVAHTHSPNSTPPLPAVADDEKLVSGLSTIFVASIQEAKDRISQIEYVFCTQLYPHFQSTAKLSESKRRRIAELEREVDEGMALQKNLVDLLRSKEALLKTTEEKRKTATGNLENCESENARLLGRIDDLEEKLRTKTREFEELELKRVENESSYRNLVEQVQSLMCELQDEKLKRNRLNEAYKRLKSQHIYLRQKVGLNEENMIRENKSLESDSDLPKHQSPITEPGIT